MLGMSVSDIAVVALLGMLAVSQLWWRTHVALVIYATCAGYVLATTWGPELMLQLGNMLPFFSTDVGQAVLSLALFLLPTILTAFQFRGSMSRRLVQQLVPALAWSIFVLAFALKLLPLSARQSLLERSEVIVQLNSFAAWSVLLAIGVASIELLSQHDLLKVKAMHRRRGRAAKDE